jgi:hypothetical protein
LIFGDLGGIFALINSVNSKERAFIEQIVGTEYLTGKHKEDDPDAIVLGEGGFGKVRLVLNVVKSGHLPVVGNPGTLL